MQPQEGCNAVFKPSISFSANSSRGPIAADERRRPTAAEPRAVAFAAAAAPFATLTGSGLGRSMQLQRKRHIAFPCSQASWLRVPSWIW